MTTIAEMVRAKPDPYSAAIACFSKRDLDREAHTVTFSFADESSLAFQISYTAIDQGKTMSKTETVPAAWLVTGPGTRGAYVNDPTHWAHGYSVVPLYTHAEQHQGEPVALPERLNAPYPHAGYPGGWNACLDEIAKLGPLYTRADPVEVERLREGISKHWKVVCDQRAELDTLRAHLAERDALFARILGKRDTCAASYWFEEIQAILSASAELEVKP